MVALASSSQNITWTCISAYHTEAGDGCENCGHGINNVFVVRSNIGAVRRVGSECVQTLTSGQAKVAIDKIAKRFTRAASQWRKKTPAALPNETREQYINRRVMEMGNAWDAYKALVALPREALGYSFKLDVKLNRIATRYLRMNGVVIPNPSKRNPDALTFDERIAQFENRAQADLYDQLRGTVKRYMVEKNRACVIANLASTYKANSFDFINASSWQVKKI